MQNFTELLMMSQRGAAHKDFSHQVHITQDNAPRTIYVADLPKSITYLELSEFMEKNIGTCVIMIKRPMFKDFYFAFVQFQKLDDARKACTEFRYPTLAGVTCRIQPFNTSKFSAGQAATFHPLNSKPPSKNTQLFVKGLPRQWTHEDLSQTFEKFGKVISCKVSIDAEHNSRGYGFVQLDSEKSAQQAITKMNGFEVAASDTCDESQLIVGEFVPRLDRVGTMKPPCNTNLYVKNFPSEHFGDSDLKLLFAEFGEIVSATVMRDDDQKSKNFGFVCYKHSDDAQKALDHFKQLAAADEDNSRRVFVSEFKTKQQRHLELQKSTYYFKKSQHLLNLIVKNVDPTATKEEFEQFFKNFGEVRVCKVIPEASLGFVCFVERDSARCAKETAELIFKGRRLQCDFCEPKESRQKRQEEQWDRQQFHRQKASQLTSNNQDVIQLITSLSLLMGQLQQKGSNQVNHGVKQQQMGQFGGGFPQGRANNGHQHRRNNYGQQQAHSSQGANHGQVMGQPHYQQRYNNSNQQMPMPTPNQMPAPQRSGDFQASGLQGQSNESQRYRNEIMTVFQSDKFMTSLSENEKKHLIGSFIFHYVTNLVTAEFSPKITGMIIDLPMADLNYAVSNLETLQVKVRSAAQLLIETNNLPKQKAQSLPIFQSATQQPTLPIQPVQQQISGF